MHVKKLEKYVLKNQLQFTNYSVSVFTSMVLAVGLV